MANFLSLLCIVLLATPADPAAAPVVRPPTPQEVQQAQQAAAAAALSPHELLPETDLEPLRVRFPAYTAVGWGWNNMAGLGVQGGYQFTAKLAADAGVGIALAGMSTGAQLRLQFLDDALSPFIAAGLHLHIPSDTEFQDEQGTFTADAHPAGFADLSIGGSYVRNDGLMAAIAVGYSQILTPRPYVVLGGTPTELGRQALQIAYGGGIMFNVVIGYAY